ncbi:hypothetical protein [Gallaecimonas xiamenensis]|uniref:Transmembrane protein n=1 Tax=Gallaecimonas xiamenensis 3-C-1 TaxID=745411 RepID=K2J1K5_9GAMM|nr:hypothetical protein [Gallaecimonas xiamenensis]EKE68657.1 hypothetical protein B3C1_16551 [Gallaecimonas xiamenensis 3-C-1]
MTQPSSVPCVLGRQCGLLAVLGVSLWSCPIIFCWGLIYHLAPTLAGIMLPLSGVLIALVVRYHGRGASSVFVLLSLLSYGVLLLTSLMFGFAIKTPGHLLVVATLVVTGLVGAWALFRARMRHDGSKALLSLLVLDRSPLGRALQNRWFLVLPLGLIGGGLSSFGGVILLASLDCFNVN